MNVKLDISLYVNLEDVAKFNGLKVSELVRHWIVEKVQETQNLRAFKTWKEKQDRDALPDRR